ncbi:MAG: hypothetical protein HY420_00170 [Candidatus Kerfeldbacteria bacterium]|nr:hypothetical protein [Candidatus Kerfeldbacteria bacterium]
MRKIAALFVMVSLISLVGCGLLDKNPVVPSSQPMLREATMADTVVGQRSIQKPGPQITAIPPSFPGWNVVSGSRTVIFGPIWDQDWKIYFYIPNCSRLPPYRVLAAKNLSGTWLDYTKYGLLYDYGQSGSYYRVVYVFGGWRANAFGINMFDATNWALYYHF